MHPFRRLSVLSVISMGLCCGWEVAPAQPTFDTSYNLDPRTVSADRELSLFGRLNNVPVSKVFYGRFRVTGSGPAVQTRAFRVSCINPTDPVDACDPGLIVKGNGIVAHEYRNSTAGNGYGAVKTFAYSGNPGPVPSATTFDVVAYSHHRGTSRVKVEYCDRLAVVACDGACSGGGEPRCEADWTTAGFTDGVTGGAVNASDVHVGGTLVHVGTVQPGDTVEVRSSNDGVPATSSKGTRIWLLNEEIGRYAFVDDGAPSDGGENDPFFIFPSDATLRWDAYTTRPMVSATKGVYALTWR